MQGIESRDTEAELAARLRDRVDDLGVHQACSRHAR